MSIQEVIRDRVAEGRLVLRDPVLKGAYSRIVLVEAGVDRDIVAGAASQDATSFRIGQLVRDLDRFRNGAIITVGYGRQKTCFMKQLDPQTDEVWEIRSRDPKPAYRLFGSFAAPDVLAILSYGPRAYLGSEDSREWKEAIRDCKARWRTLFNPYQPYQGAVANDYIQRNVLVVGDIP